MGISCLARFRQRVRSPSLPTEAYGVCWVYLGEVITMRGEGDMRLASGGHDGGDSNVIPLVGGMTD